MLAVDLIASFTMVAFTSLICERQSRLHFTHGEIVGDMTKFTVTDFRTRKTTHHVPANEGGGHGGGDLGLIRTFVDAVRTGQQELLGTDVTDAFRLYLRPLLGSGMPDAFRLRPAPVPKVLRRGG